MKPIVLLINDIHISKDNIPEFEKNWEEAIRVCRDNGINHIVIGGDLWLSRSSQTLSVLMAVRNALLIATQSDIHVTIAEGNHCKVNQEFVLGYSHIFSEYPGVSVIDCYTIINISYNVQLYVMSYFPENGSFVPRLNAMIAENLDKTKRNILYIHEGIRGGLAQPSDDELPASIFDDFDATLVGHYHNRNKIKGTNIEYIGSSRQHNFGEDEEKGYTIIYDDGSYRFVKNEANIRYKVVDLNVDDINGGADLKQEGYKVKVRVHCKSSESSAIDRQQLLEMGCTKVEVVAEDKTVAADNHALEQKFDKSGVKDEYVNFCTEKGVSDVEVGLFYLDQID